MTNHFFILTFFIGFACLNASLGAQPYNGTIEYGPQTFELFQKLKELGILKTVDSPKEKVNRSSVAKKNILDLPEMVTKNTIENNEVKTAPQKQSLNGSLPKKVRPKKLKENRDLKAEEIKLVESLKVKHKFQDKCLNEPVCETFFKEGKEILKQRKNEARLNSFIKTLTLMTKKECFDPDARTPESVITDHFKICFKGPLEKQSEAEKILLSVHNSRFKQGRAFTQTEAFQSTLNDTREEFYRVDQEGEEMLPALLKVSVGNQPSIFSRQDVECVDKTEMKVEELESSVDSENAAQKSDVVYHLNEYATARLEELTANRLGQKINISACGGATRQILVSSVVKSGVVSVGGLIPAEVDCIQEKQWCKKGK